MWTIIDIAFYFAALATCRFRKDPVLAFLSGTDAPIKSPEFKLAALRRAA